MGFFHILAATDFGPAGDAAVARAAALAKEGGARLTLVHVVPDVPVPSDLGFPHYPVVLGDAELDEVFAHVRSALLARVPEPLRAELQITPVARRGNPRDEVLDVAKHVGCDLIVLGTHGRRGLSRALLGSVAEQLVRLAPCNVLVVRDPAQT
jgi:nucleotide-binding universal stress UspA family protein